MTPRERSLALVRDAIGEMGVTMEQIIARGDKRSIIGVARRRAWLLLNQRGWSCDTIGKHFKRHRSVVHVGIRIEKLSPRFSGENLIPAIPLARKNVYRTSHEPSANMADPEVCGGGSADPHPAAGKPVSITDLFPASRQGGERDAA